MVSLQQKLSYLMLGQKGGKNRLQIIELLKERPYNRNQLADILQLNYRTIKHHIDVLLKNDLISQSKTIGYGEIYYLTPEMEGNMSILETIHKKLEQSRKLKNFTNRSKFYQQLLERTNNAMIITDHDLQVFFWNESASRIFGYTREEIIGGILPIFSDRSLLKTIMGDHTNDITIIDREVQGKHRSGQPIDISVTIDTIKDVNENGIGLSILVSDITDRKRAEEALQRAEEQHRLALRAANMGSWDWDIKTGNLSWSERIEPLFGLRTGEFSGTYNAFLERVHPDDRQRVEDSINICIEEGSDYDIEHRIVWPDGSVRWVHEIGNVIRDEHGIAIRMLGIVRDITSKK